MLPILSLCILALAVSLDGFGVGVMYGLRKIKIPLLSIIIISLCSGLVIFASMQLGVILARYLAPAFSKMIGAVILIGIGAWAVVQMRRHKDQINGPVSLSATEAEPEHIVQPKQTILRIELKRLGLVIQIFKSPSLADMDRSGTISSSEAVLLGTALSLDAFGAGIGAALIGFAPLLTAAVIALTSGIFIASGLRIGLVYSDFRWIRKISVLPGFILIFIGIIKLL